LLLFSLLFVASFVSLAKVASTLTGAFPYLGFRVSRLLRTCPLAIGSILSIEIELSAFVLGRD